MQFYAIKLQEFANIAQEVEICKDSGNLKMWFDEKGCQLSPLLSLYCQYSPLYADIY